MMDLVRLLFDVLRAEINGEIVDAERFRSVDLKRLFLIAKIHDVSYCVINALNKVNLLPRGDGFNEFSKEKQLAFFRVSRIESVLDNIKTVLSDSRIDFIPLKGSVIRSLYPDKMMRLSCDIDVLVKEESLQTAIDALKKAGFTTDEKINCHDVSMFFGEVHLELHFTMCDYKDDANGLLERAWEFAEPTDREYEYRLKSEFFVFHHIAHMRRHFYNGGCGIKPFMDLYVMRKKGFYEEEKVLPLLESVELTKFYNSILQMIGVWFENKPHTELTKKIEEYVLRGGVYGSLPNLAVSENCRGENRSVWRLFFPKYDRMCIIYPKLKKRKILLPIYYVIRLFSRAFGKDSKRNRKRFSKRFKTIVSTDKNEVKDFEKLLIEMGLKKGENQ